MSPKTGFYGWKLLAILWLILFTNFAFCMYGSSVINAYMAADLRFDRTTLGSTFAVFQWMTGLPGPLVALLVNRKGVRFTLVAGALMVIAGAVLMVLLVHTRLEVYAVFSMLIGLGTVTCGPLAAQSGIARWFTRRKALAISLVLTGGPIGGLVAPPLLNRVIEHFHGNWRAAWCVVAILSAIATLLAAAFVKERPADLGQLPDGDSALPASTAARARRTVGVYHTTREWTSGEAFRTPAFWIILVSALGFSAGFSLFLSHGVVHLKDLGHTAAQAALSFSAIMLASLLGKLLVGALGDIIEPKFIWAAGLLAFAAGILLALDARGTAALYGYALCLGLGFGLAFACLMTLPSNYFGPKAYPAVIGVLAATGTTAGAAGTYAAGYSYDHLGSYAPAFYAVAALCLAGFALVLFMTPPQESAPRALAAVAGEQPQG